MDTEGMPSQAPLKTGLFASTLVILIVGAFLAVWTMGVRQECTFCIVTVTGAYTANIWAGAAAFLAIGAIAVGGALQSRAGTQASIPVVTGIVGALLGLGIIAAIIAVATLIDQPFVSDARSAATIAGTAVGLFFLYLALIALLLGLRGAFSTGGGGARAVAIPIHDESFHVMTIEGIGTKYATRLNARGIITIPQLLSLPPTTVATYADCTHQLAEEWQGEARLQQVKGIGPQFAEILAMTGLRTVHDLANSDVDELLRKVEAIESRRKTRVLKVDVQRHHIEKFVQAARQHVAESG